MTKNLWLRHSTPVVVVKNRFINFRHTHSGHGGGAATNKYGKEFENKTSNEGRLLRDGFIKTSFVVVTPRTSYKKIEKRKHQYYLSKTVQNTTTVFLTQNNFKTYMKMKYRIDVFRCPDEAYIICNNNAAACGGANTIAVKILEKKEQRVEGSVETKLWSGPSLKREYSLVLGSRFCVDYAFCVNNFLQNKITPPTPHHKYTILNTILAENNIAVLFGDEPDYFEKLCVWYGDVSPLTP